MNVVLVPDSPFCACVNAVLVPDKPFCALVNVVLVPDKSLCALVNLFLFQTTLYNEKLVLGIDLFSHSSILPTTSFIKMGCSSMCHNLSYFPFTHYIFHATAGIKDCGKLIQSEDGYSVHVSTTFSHSIYLLCIGTER